MTYLLYTAWLGSILLAVGELDTISRHVLSRRFKVSYPDASWWMSVFASACFPGLGQLLNGQPLKALLLIAWPFLTMLRAPIPPPWQMLAIKSPWFLLPAWALSILDALIVALAAERKRRAAFAPIPGHDDKLTAYLQRRAQATEPRRDHEA